MLTFFQMSLLRALARLLLNALPHFSVCPVSVHAALPHLHIAMRCRTFGWTPHYRLVPPFPLMVT